MPSARLTKLPPMAKRTSVPLAEELPELLKERGLSLLALSRSAGVSDAHLHRIIRGQKRATGHVARDVALALELAPDYFPETRAEFVCNAVLNDPVLRDRLYDSLARSQRQRRP